VREEREIVKGKTDTGSQSHLRTYEVERGRDLEQGGGGRDNSRRKKKPLPPHCNQGPKSSLKRTGENGTGGGEEKGNLESHAGYFLTKEGKSEPSKGIPEKWLCRERKEGN